MGSVMRLRFGCLACFLVAACGSGGKDDRTGFGTGGASTTGGVGGGAGSIGAAGAAGVGGGCSPADERVCTCFGVPNGSQTCGADGRLTECPPCMGTGGASGGGGTGGGTAGTGGATCTNHCSNGSRDCGETEVDCGGPCPDCAPFVYVESDCIKAARNGSEICDDAAWQVEAPGDDLVLVCLTDAGGTIYVSTNTGPPDPNDGIERCQGWEINGQDAWDNLNYLDQLVCNTEQQQIDLDLSGRVGQRIYVGAHNDPSGGGQFTHMCLARKR